MCSVEYAILERTRFHFEGCLWSCSHVFVVFQLHRAHTKLTLLPTFASCMVHCKMERSTCDIPHDGDSLYPCKFSVEHEGHEDVHSSFILF